MMFQSVTRTRGRIWRMEAVTVHTLPGGRSQNLLNQCFLTIEVLTQTAARLGICLWKHRRRQSRKTQTVIQVRMTWWPTIFLSHHRLHARRGPPISRRTPTKNEIFGQHLPLAGLPSWKLPWIVNILPPDRQCLVQ